MMEMIELLNAERAAEGKPALAIGVGIATGDVFAGYTGTQERATYTCVGDTVNLAARLEAHTKQAGRGILIDGATQSALGGRVASDALGPVQLKGKAQAVDVFALAAARRA
jgi:class 3 adenylate cyclase